MKNLPFNFPVVARMLGSLILIESCFMLIPLIVALCYGEADAARAFGISATITAFVGACCTFCIKRSGQMGRYDGALLTALIWVVFSLFGLLPYMFAPNTQLSFNDAFFEAMSAFTTSGASLIESIDRLSHAVHIWRCLSEWIGGLGIILFTVALLPMFNSSGGLQMLNAEQIKVTPNKVAPRVNTTARRILMLYVSLTIVLFFLLWIGPMSAFESLCHSFAVMSTGGFSTSSEGINQFDTFYVKAIITLFMFIASVNFFLAYRAIMGQPKALLGSETFINFGKIILIVSAISAVCIYLNGAYTGWQSVTIDPLFMVVSIITSTGYMLHDFQYWGPTVMMLSLCLVFIGGCSGSTSGGVKVDRVTTLLKFLKNEIRRALRPNAVRAVRINSVSIPSEHVGSQIGFLALYLLIVVVAAVVLTVLGLPLNQAFTSSLLSMGNASMSITDAPIGCDYASMGTGAHYLLAFLMLVGRLEIFTVLVLFSRTFWRRR